MPEQTARRGMRFLRWYFLPPLDGARGWPWQRQYWMRLLRLCGWGFRISILLTPILMYFGVLPSA